MTDRAFAWVDLPDGRARFSGGSGGGAEELAHDTFAVEIGGRVLFGEVRKRYDGDALYLEIPTFGDPIESRVGIPAARVALSPIDVERTERLVRELAAAVGSYPNDDRPYVLRLLDGVVASGEVRFDPAWVVVAGDEAPLR